MAEKLRSQNFDNNNHCDDDFHLNSNDHYSVYCSKESVPLDSLEELLSFSSKVIMSRKDKKNIKNSSSSSKLVDDDVECYYIPKRISRCDYRGRYDGCSNNDYSSKVTSVPLTLICHDMKNGYLDDRFVIFH